MQTLELTQSIKNKAKEIGFDLVAISPVGEFPENQFFKEWISRGFGGEMHYLENNADKRADIEKVLPGAKSVICCAIYYNTDNPYSTDCFDSDKGWVSRYSWGNDYHEIVGKKLLQLVEQLRILVPNGLRYKYYVDTGPVLEKVFSKYSGIGWIGKNTCLINQQAGSWLFVGEIISDIELDYDSPVPDRCGTCTRCIDACPTDAIVEPYVLDSRKCISYLTIELKGSIPVDLREGMGNNIYGCDICQDVCPWNKHAHVTDNSNFIPREGLLNPDLSTLSNLDQDGFRKLFKNSPIKRTKRRGLLRNVMIAMGNSGNKDFIHIIKEALRDEEPVVRAAAVWACWKIEGDDSFEELAILLNNEASQLVRDEILNILN